MDVVMHERIVIVIKREIYLTFRIYPDTLVFLVIQYQPSHILTVTAGLWCDVVYMVLSDWQAIYTYVAACLSVYRIGSWTTCIVLCIHKLGTELHSHTQATQ